MFKLIGALGVISSCGFLGFSFASKIEKRLYNTGKIINMLEEFEIFLNYGVMTKQEIFGKIFEKNEYSDYSEEKISECVLSEDEKAAVKDFYRQFGTTDLQGQLSAVLMYKKLFEESYKDQKAVKENKCRLYRTAGILSGIFICLLLV